MFKLSAEEDLFRKVTVVLNLECREKASHDKEGEHSEREYHMQSPEVGA
jgi:hypothetical protein